MGGVGIALSSKIVNLRHLKIWLVLTALAFGQVGFSSVSFCARIKKKIASVLSLSHSSQHQEWIAIAHERLRGVLGSLFPADHEVEVAFQACLTETGAIYEPAFNVLQMDTARLPKDKESFITIYTHELMHSISNRRNPAWENFRKGIGPVKQRYQLAMTRVNRTRERILDKKIKGSEEDLANLYEKLEGIEDRVSEELFQATKDYESVHPKAKLTLPKNEEFVDTSYEELLSDLAACASKGDGDAMARALKKITRRYFKGRSNTVEEEIPATERWEYLGFIDPHETLKNARTIIWKKYIDGKSEAEIQKAFAVLYECGNYWPARESSAVVAEVSSVTGETFWKVDVNRLNRNFLEEFEKRFNGN